jgi:hypothetical protein
MTGFFIKTVSVLCFFTITTGVSTFGKTGAEMIEKTSKLPKTIGVWTRPKAARIIDRSNVFEYMNGAGELYLAYRFDRLEVYEYVSDQEDNILVELYFMKASNDAFGLLSMDWGGKPTEIYSRALLPANPTVSPSVRALYGAGLLRIWADTIYARVMATRETTESKETVLSLGRTIGAGRKMPNEPALLKILPEAIESDWKLRRDRILYFRSHLILNSVYYLSHQNILQLDHSTEAVTAHYEKKSDMGVTKGLQVLFVRYASAERAREALGSFHSNYLHDQKKAFNPGVTEESGNFFHIEDGWLGYLRDGRCVAIVFECEERQTAQSVLKQLLYEALNEENEYGE